MKVLDLFCGMGGWSIPFIEDGDEVWGLDIQDYGYPGKFIQSDIRELDGYGFSDMDLIIGSPPCREFSVAGRFGNGKGKWHWKIPQDPQRGMILVREFKRFVKEASPQFWAMENVTNGEAHINAEMGRPTWHFRITRQGHRTLWSNVSIPFTNEYAPDNRLMKVKKACHGKPIKRVRQPQSLRGAERAQIPYPIARFVADSVRRVTE